ncbi:MAG TPA: acyl-CoA dehydrogenase family protein [Burkholderiaceae bacterium]|nr:acyl-CoA dehydrogenase family protein [Burkholderiaceae bacterium]
MNRQTNTATVTRLADVNPKDLKSRAQAVAAIAAKYTDSVDSTARFPKEAFDAIRTERLLGILVPTALGGEGASLADVTDVCYQLAQACSSTGMIYAMHQVKVACLVRHYQGSRAVEGILRHLAAEQLLLASSTTEGQAGGNVRASEAPVIVSGDTFTLERRATCISYGAQADGIVTTARRSPDAAASDQVLVAVLKSNYTLDHLQGWDTLGMRGTCSDGYLLKASGTRDHILSVPYEKIHVETMVPTAHLCWGSVWAGIAASATARAQSFIRHAARHGNGQLPPAAAHFTKAMTTLRTLRGLLASGLANYERVMNDEKAMSSLEFQSMITLTKVEASELALKTVMDAMRACGLSGYRNDTEFSIGRHLRDVLSSPIMINNDRILANLATPALMTAIPQSLQG